MYKEEYVHKMNMLFLVKFTFSTCEGSQSYDLTYNLTHVQMWDEKQSPQSLSLEGLSLVAGRDLFSEEVTAQLKELQGQDLVASHLEALQVLESSSLPLMWITGAKFTLYPDPLCNTQRFTYSQ